MSRKYRGIANNKGAFVQIGMLLVILIIVVAVAAAGIKYMNAGTALREQQMSAVEQVGQVPVGQVSPVLGESITGYVDAFDLEANTQTEIYPGYAIHYSDNDEKLRDWDSASSTAATFGVGAVGRRIDVYAGGSNATQLCQPMFNKLIEDRTPHIQLDCWTVMQHSGWNVKLYDRNSNALSAGQNTTQEDYYIDEVAGGTEDVIVELNNNNSDKIIPLKALALGWANDVDDFEYLGIRDWSAGVEFFESDSNKDLWTKRTSPSKEFVKVTMPANVSDAKLTAAEGSFEYDEVFAYGGEENPSFIMVHEGDWIQFDFRAHADDNTAPAATNTSTDNDCIFFEFLDGDWEENTLGVPEFDFYAHTTSETTAGGIEELDSPLGKENGAIIQLQ